MHLIKYERVEGRDWHLDLLFVEDNQEPISLRKRKHPKCRFQQTKQND